MKKKTKTDNSIINHPSHYTTGNIEVIDFIEDQELNFHLGNAVKLIVSADKKTGEMDFENLKKAKWYLDRFIENYE